jgi:hypothetical protein
MGSVRQRLLRLRCAIPILATAFTLVALPAVAAAVPPPPTAVSYASGTGLRIVDGVGAASIIDITFLTSSRYHVRSGTPLTPVAPCTADTTGFGVSCAVTGSKLITAELEAFPNVLNGSCVGTGLGDMIVSAGSGNDVLNGGPGFDLLEGEGGNDTLDGCAGDDVLEGGRDNDRLTECKQPSTAVVPSADVLDGGSGIDTVEYGAGPGCSAAVTVTLDNQANDGMSGQHDNVKSDVPSHPVLTGHSIRPRRSACRESRRLVWRRRPRAAGARSGGPEASAKCAGRRDARRGS